MAIKPKKPATPTKKLPVAKAPSEKSRKRAVRIRELQAEIAGLKDKLAETRLNADNVAHEELSAREETIRELEAREETIRELEGALSQYRQAVPELARQRDAAKEELEMYKARVAELDVRILNLRNELGAAREIIVFYDQQLALLQSVKIRDDKTCRNRIRFWQAIAACGWVGLIGSLVLGFWF